MMVPYCDAFEIADKIGAFMKQAVALRAEKKDAEARALVMDNAVPLWLKVAPMVRDTMLTYQAIVATRNDQGQLASMQATQPSSTTRPLRATLGRCRHHRKRQPIFIR